MPSLHASSPVFDLVDIRVRNGKIVEIFGEGAMGGLRCHTTLPDHRELDMPFA